MRRLVGSLSFAVGVVLLASCGDQPEATPLPRAEVRDFPGPTYVEQVLNGHAQTLIHTPSHVTRIPDYAEVFWRGDGLAVVSRRERARLLEPATGRWVSAPVRVGSIGLTPTNLTTIGLPSSNDVTVYDARLRKVRAIRVPRSAATSDQVGPDSPFQIHGRPLTLHGVTWVEWGINSEDDTLTDHGLLRIEGDRITEALRNEPLVNLRASSDGSALLALMQDNGRDEDCGGCQVEQRIAELDPKTGKLAREYDMPDGYSRGWRVSALDKVRGHLVVQFAIRRGESGGHYETWRWGEDWSRVTEAGDTRTRFQDGGAIAWRGDTGEENQPFALTWTPAAGPAATLRDLRTPCPTDRTDWTSCPSISLPGSLLPLSSK